MFEPVSTGVAISLLVKSASSWLPAVSEVLIPPVRDALLGKGAERAFDKLNEQRHKIFHLDEKEQKRHLELALKNAAERGLAQFQTPEEQQQYNEVIHLLSTSYSDALRRDALGLNEPDYEKLAALFDQARAQAQPAQVQAIDATPYLSSFFESLSAELYADRYFKQQMSDVLQARAGLNIQRSLTEVLSTLNQIGETLADNYTPEQFEEDVKAYTEHVERTLRYLRLVGVVPKERINENRDPELDGIFVPLRIAIQENIALSQKVPDFLVDLLAQTSCMVLLGGPGSGKSTATRHLAWSHAVANLSNSRSLTTSPLLSGKPLPLRIELRRLNEDRRQRPDYGFLTFASEVLLGRAGLNIPPQMFELLLERRTMLVLFDGLDEVATLDDRRTLVEEIDSFAQQYPGNRFLVTSRPVGYNLAPLSTHTFAETHAQPFDDEQIHQFLENWYRHVLRLSPLSQDDQRELEELHTNLKENPRLHVLAENPLLLTVMTALHRYERLPDKRILVYDRCADLLLETWARLKGTDARWQDLKLGKEDQYACVAHLGFVLHERSQQEADTNGTGTQAKGNFANDVPSRFMLREIERFLQRQNLFSSIAEQNKQASRFLDLIKEEAGLIVERGTDENGESLYGFVHRTFQEYFAAADVYERYQQEEDASIISEFLRKHLHDPHWREVILLLFGKLKRKPVTNQMKQILEGKIQSRRSKYNDILQQDFFFVCDCLVEGIAVESDFAEFVISHLSDIVKDSPFPSQRTRAIYVFSLLIQTQQYSNLGQQGLVALVTKGNIADLFTELEAIQALYKSCSNNVERRLEAIQAFLNLAQRPDLSTEQAALVIHTLYQISPSQSKEEQQAAKLLFNIVLRPEIPVERVIKRAEYLLEYINDPDDLEEWQQSLPVLSGLAERSDLSARQTIQLARLLFKVGRSNSKIHHRANRMLSQLLEQANLTAESIISIAQMIYGYNPSNLQERQHAVQMLLDISQRSNLSFKQTLRIAEIFYNWAYPNLDLKEQATEMLLSMIQTYGLDVEQQTLVVETICKYHVAFNKQVFQILLDISKQPDLSIAQLVCVAKALNRCHLYLESASSSKQFILDTNDNSSLDDTFVPFTFEEVVCEEAVGLLLGLAQRPNLTVEQTILVAESLYICGSSSVKQQAIERLLSLVQRPNLTVEQIISIARARYDCTDILSPFASDERQQATQILLDAMQEHSFSAEKFVQLARALYKISLDKSAERQQMIRLLSNLARQPDLSTDEIILVAQALYEYSISGSNEELQAANIFQRLEQNANLTNQQRLQAATTPLVVRKANFRDRTQAIHIILTLFKRDTVKRYLTENWQQTYDTPHQLSLFEEYNPYSNVNISDIPYIVELAEQKLLPTKARDEMYRMLSEMVPQFASLDISSG